VILARAEEEGARSVGVIMDERLVTVIVILLTIMVVTVPALVSTVITCVDIRLDTWLAISGGVPPP